MIEGIIVQGTTPILQFMLPSPVKFIKDARFCFSQRGKEILTKTLADCSYTLEEADIELQLTQEDTFLFEEDKGIIDLQIRVLNQDSLVITAKEIHLKPENLPDKVVMQ